MTRFGMLVGLMVLFWSLVLCGSDSLADEKDRGDMKKELRAGIVLAVFGTSHETALNAILNSYDSVVKAFPNTSVKLAFTSNMIRRIWQKRAADPEYRKAHPEVLEIILNVKGVLASIAELQDSGMDYIIVQPVHMAAGEEYADLASYVDGLNSIRTMKPKNMPFKRIILSRPIMGAYDLKHEYTEDLKELANLLKPDVDEARAKGQVLVYMAHGNEYMPAGYYMEFEYLMNQMYPDVNTFITMVEGFPGLDVLRKKLKHVKAKKVVLRPLMVVAGDHAKNDMAGDEPDSIQSILKKDGFKVEAELRGLGSLSGFGDMVVSRVRDAAADAGVELK
ncbi:MAG: sirohydrochlorin cobaltochelatase [Dissulfuribacterales bacterium]